MKKTFIALALVSLFFVNPASASAASLDLTVSPVFLDYSPNPGDVIKGVLRVHNNTTAPMTLKVSLNKMDINDRGDVIPTDIAITDTTQNWFKFENPQITAPTKEWYDVPFTLTIPQNAAFGNYFAVAFSGESPKVTGNTTVVQGNVLIPVLINVKKAGSIAEAKISEFKVANFINEYMPVDFSVSVKNTGNIHLSPRGNIFIRGTGEKDLGVLEVNSGRGNILPNTSRNFSSSWSDGFIVREKNADGNGTHLVFNWNKLTSFRIGKYTAYVLMAYDDGKRDVPIEATLTFWVFPWKAVGIGLTAIILIFVGISTGIKAMVRREAKKIHG